MSNPNLYVKKRTTVNEIFNNDPERIELYNKIVESLITAGYFRARINSLEPFDKILGGMAWILTGCFYDIDIEFKDEMNLTEKIRVSEKIVAGLKAINYPMTLNPVQIQGLDLKPLYQCLQWLQKRLLETRDERNALNKKISVNFYDKEYTEPSEAQLKLSNDTDEMLNAKYNALKENRKYKPKSKLSFNYNDELRVYFGCIEFGVKDIAFQRQFIELLKKKKIVEDKNKNAKGGASGTPGGIGKMQTGGDSQDKLTKEEMKILNDVMNNNIEEISNQEKQKVNASIIEAIFSENMQYISAEIENFDNAKGDENIDKIKLYAKEKERLEQNKMNIISQINQYEGELNNCQQQETQEKEEIARLQNEIEKLKATLAQNERNRETILQKVKEDDQLSMEKLAFLAEKNKRKEELKSKISKFKKDCLAEKKVYDAQLENYQKKIEKLNDSENIAVFNEIDVNYNAELQKNTAKKKDLFDQNKIINMLTRKIQLYPSKLEIIQYQKRFQELYEQINKVSERSNKILGENNSKSQVIALLQQKEATFVDLRNLYKGLKPKEKDKFKTTLNNVTSTLTPSLDNSNKKLNDLFESIDKSQKQLNDFRLHEANYLRLIKEYNKEYNKYSANM